jgi:lipopolysaccharide/colanic/teichoic acid biosynthesis glycosyltransferase
VHTPASAPAVGSDPADGPSTWLSFRLVADRVLAAVLSVLTAPLVAVLAVLIRRHDGHPPLITVPRVGRDGRVFGMWKLRSMRVDTADGRASGVALTSTNDDRITPIGARMRSLHLDEVPQLYNVVRGEMCLLGPRPEAPEFVDLDDEVWQAVLRVPPGVAGPTQLIVGDWERTQIDQDVEGDVYRRVVVPVKLAIDRWYVQTATPRLDLLTLTSLVRHVVPGATVRTLQDRVRSAVPDARAPIDATP